MQPLCYHHGSNQRALTVEQESLYCWFPVFKVWIQLLQYIQINYIFSVLVKSNLVKLETSCTVIFPPMLVLLQSYHGPYEKFTIT